MAVVSFKRRKDNWRSAGLKPLLLHSAMQVCISVARRPNSFVCIALPFSNSFRYGSVAVTQLAHARRSREPQQLFLRDHLSKLARFEKPQTSDMNGHQSNLHTHQKAETRPALNLRSSSTTSSRKVLVGTV